MSLTEQFARASKHSGADEARVRRVLAGLLELDHVERVFGEALDLDEYSDYLQVVQRPMDLGTVRGEPPAQHVCAVSCHGPGPAPSAPAAAARRR